MIGQSLTGSTSECGETNRIDVSTALVIRFAEEIGADVHELPPLYGTIDPEALNHLVDSGSDDLEVSFTYCDHRIRLTGSGTVSIDPLE